MRILFALLLVLSSCQMPLRSAPTEMSNAEWLQLVALLQQQGPICIAKEDRRFLDEMANLLTLDDPPLVMRWQRKWLLAVKRECRL